MRAPKRTRTVTLLAVVRSLSVSMVDELITRIHAAGYGDITASHHLVFENIDPEGTRLTELAKRAGMARQSMTELVTVLERNGYLELRRDPADGRARLVCLTRKGRALVRVALAEITVIESDWQQSSERAGLNSNLTQLLVHVIEAHANRPTA